MLGGTFGLGGMACTARQACRAISQNVAIGEHDIADGLKRRILYNGQGYWRGYWLYKWRSNRRILKVKQADSEGQTVGGIIEIADGGQTAGRSEGLKEDLGRSRWREC